MELLRLAVTANARAHTGVYRVYRGYIGGTLYRGYIGVGVTMEFLCTPRGATPTSTSTPPYPNTLTPTSTPPTPTDPCRVYTLTFPLVLPLLSPPYPN